MMNKNQTFPKIELKTLEEGLYVKNEDVGYGFVNIQIWRCRSGHMSENRK